MIAHGPLGSLGRPAWRPDGKVVAFGVSNQDDEDPRTDISLADAAGGETAPVAKGLARVGRTLSFSPDGTLLAFDRGRDGSLVRDVTTIDVDSGELTTLQPGETPAYGPDGSLVYTRGDPMRILAPDGTERAFNPPRGQGDPSEFGHRRPSFSPDGTAIVFERQDGHNSWIETAPLTGGATTVLTPQTSDDHNPTWGPGGPVVTPPPTVSVADATAPEGSELGFAVTLSAPTAAPVTVTASTSSGSAASGTDFTAKSQAVTIPAGSTGASFNVQSTQDAADEPDSVTVSVSSGSSRPIPSTRAAS